MPRSVRPSRSILGSRAVAPRRLRRPPPPPLLVALGDLMLDVVVTPSRAIERGTDVPGTVVFRRGGLRCQRVRRVRPRGRACPPGRERRKRPVGHPGPRRGARGGRPPRHRASRGAERSARGRPRFRRRALVRHAARDRGRAPAERPEAELACGRRLSPRTRLLALRPPDRGRRRTRGRARAGGPRAREPRPFLARPIARARRGSRHGWAGAPLGRTCCSPTGTRRQRCSAAARPRPCPACSAWPRSSWSRTAGPGPACCGRTRPRAGRTRSRSRPSASASPTRPGQGTPSRPASSTSSLTREPVPAPWAGEGGAMDAALLRRAALAGHRAAGRAIARRAPTLELG